MTERKSHIQPAIVEKKRKGSEKCAQYTRLKFLKSIFHVKYQIYFLIF